MIYYFDNNSTTLLPNKIQNKMQRWMSCGNPSNIHHILGRNASKSIDKSRNEIANILNVNPNELYFTSGATEANNIAINGIINNSKKKKKHIITSAFEHKCILETCKNLEKNNDITVTYIKPDTVFIMKDGNIVKTGGKDLAEQIEEEGFQ